MTSALTEDAMEPIDYATLAFLDEHVTKRVTSAHLPADVEAKLKAVIAAAGRFAIADGMVAMTKSPIIPIIENLFAMSFGWSDLSGKSIEAVQGKFEEALQSLLIATASMNVSSQMKDARNRLLDLLASDIESFVDTERVRVEKLEKRQVDAALGQLKAERSRQLAVSTLNSLMKGRIIPQEIVDFLQGEWFNSMQLIANRKGESSSDWRQVVQLTDTLISTLQPSSMEAQTSKDLDDLQRDDASSLGMLESDTDGESDGVPVDEPGQAVPDVQAEATSEIADQQLYRIIENLAEEISTSLVSIEHDERALGEALAVLESVHVKLLKGEAVEGAEFDLLPDERARLDENTRISKSLLAPVRKLEPHSWFFMADEEDQNRHLKLTMRDTQSQHLIFTNRNGGNPVQTSFEEFAYLLSTEKVIPLPQPGSLLKDLRLKLLDCLKQKMKADKADEVRQRREASESFAQALDRTQFLLLALERDQLERTTEDIVISRSDLQAARSAANGDTRLIFLDQTGFMLTAPGSEEILSLISGASIEVEDEMPVGMETFRTAVMNMRGRARLDSVVDNE
jgi:hypothetical protein